MKHLIALIIMAVLVYGCAKNSGPNPVTPPAPEPERMLLIPAGTFRMGNITNYPGPLVENEAPVHNVTLTRSFLMGRTEVTQAQWKAVMGANPSRYKGDDLPVEVVSWYDAVAYCNRLSRLEGYDTCYTWTGSNYSCNFAANGYRLPTEAEWEYACRAGTETDLYTGNTTTAVRDSALMRAGWYNGNAQSTHPVGLKEPNAFGLYDMHGNVAEWCWDWYAGPYDTTNTATNPTGASTGFSRVYRGGSWNSSTYTCRSSFRGDIQPQYKTSTRGFRVVRSN